MPAPAVPGALGQVRGAMRTGQSRCDDGRAGRRGLRHGSAAEQRTTEQQSGSQHTGADGPGCRGTHRTQ
ncbi:hypothetical protein [Mycobacterium kiyosense]